MHVQNSERMIVNGGMCKRNEIVITLNTELHLVTPGVLKFRGFQLNDVKLGEVASC